MATPTPYNRTTSFTNTFAANPTQVFPGASLDVELNNIQITISQIIANLGLIQNNDGTLGNGTVGVNQLGSSLITLPSGTAIGSVGTIRVVAIGVDFNAGSTDTAVTIPIPAGISRYVVSDVRISNASASISSATLGVFTGAGATGVTVVTNAAVTVTTAAADTAANTQSMTIAATTTALTDTTLYVRVGTAQGSAATADVIIDFKPLS